MQNALAGFWVFDIMLTIPLSVQCFGLGLEKLWCLSVDGREQYRSDVTQWSLLLLLFSKISILLFGSSLQWGWVFFKFARWRNSLSFSLSPFRRCDAEWWLRVPGRQKKLICLVRYEKPFVNLKTLQETLNLRVIYDLLESEYEFVSAAEIYWMIAQLPRRGSNEENFASNQFLFCQMFVSEE